MIRLFFAFLAACVLTAGSSHAQDYRLRSGDLIDVSVLEDPSLNRRALIRPDGKISMPLAGTVRAAGLTPERLQAVIREQLMPNFVDGPSVTVSLIALRPPEIEVEEEVVEEEEEIVLHSVYVIGEVARPGRYEFDMEKPINALQALSLSGGPDVFAAKKRIQIRRMIDGQEQIILFDYTKVERGEMPIEELRIVDGDVIVVPERGLFE